MLIKEILVETTDSSYDITLLADYVGINLQKFIKFVQGDTSLFTIELISKVLKVPIPDTHSDEIKTLLCNETIFCLTPEVGVASFSPYISLDSPFRCLIRLNLKEMDTKLDISRCVAHEMQHAVDYINRKDKKYTGSSVALMGMEKYLTDPTEINARFAEVLYLLAKVTKPESEIYNFIDRALDAHLLSPKSWPNDPKAQQRFNHLKVRAYKFYQKVKVLNPKNNPMSKQTWFSKVKNLIKKFAYST